MPNENYATKPLPVVVFADFICPYSYIALDQMDDLLRDYNIELIWRPHWLHPEVPPEGAPLPAEATPLPAEATRVPANAASLRAEATPLPATRVPAEASPRPAEAAPLTADAETIPAEATRVPANATPRLAEAASGDRRTRTLAWLKEMAPHRAAHMRFPDKLQFSLFAFEALEFAQDRGLALPFKTAVFEALWIEGCDIAQFSTLQAAAEKVGLDADELGRALSEKRYRNRVRDSLHLAREAGITKTPTFILGRYRIAGWHYYEVFQTVMDKQGVPLRSAASLSARER